jgi:hypothetical protein
VSEGERRLTTHPAWQAGRVTAASPSVHRPRLFLFSVLLGGLLSFGPAARAQPVWVGAAPSPSAGTVPPSPSTTSSGTVPPSASAAALGAPAGASGRSGANLAPPSTATGASASTLSAPTETATTAEVEAAEAREEGRTDPMPWASLAVRVGVAQVRSGKIKNPTYNAAYAAQAAQLPPEAIAASGYVGGGACTILDTKCRTDGRFGFHLVAALHLGGDGFGWDLEPYFTHGASSLAYGLYTGPKFDIHAADPLYVGFGFGVRAAYVQADGWLYGADLGARVPLHAVLYVTDDLAVELDFGIGLGASGYMSKQIDVMNPVTGASLARAPRLTFGLARTWDLSIGLRFP